MFVARRILIITNEMKFALNVKKALERNGKYTVAVFSSGRAGVDYVRSHEQDVAVVDFRMKDMPGTDMVDHLRTLQHDIAVIAAPNHPAIHDLKERYNIQNIINVPTSIRKFVASLENAKQDMATVQNDNKAQIEGLSVERNAQTLEYWLATNEAGGTVLQEIKPLEEPDITPEASAIFQRLLAEEPPMPKFADGSTIRDLRDSLKNIEEIQRVLAKVSEEETEPGEVIMGDTASIPAAMLLSAAMDESTPIQTFTLEEFMTRANESTGGKVNPLPSWKRKAEQYVTEPDFLNVNLPFSELDESIEYTGTVTIINELNLDAQNPGDWTTDPIVPVQRSHPIEPEKQAPETLEDDATLQETSTLNDAEARQHVADLGRPAPPPPPPELPDIAVSQGTEAGLPFVDFNEDDAELAQLATTLTQVALELTADATILARDGKIVGYAGKIPMSDLEGLLHEVTIEWDESRASDKSRIVFATLPDSGAEFMVSTRGTDAGFTLSLIFSGTRPLPDIRRQSKRLIEALASMPELEPEPEPQASEKLEISQPAIAIPDTEEIGIRTPIAYLWLTRDPNTGFDNDTQTKILKALDVELTSSGWKVSDIHAPDYVYIYGEMPASLNPREMLDELMQKTAGLIQADAKTIWDDSYLILQPGREMKASEIQRFINFARR